EEMARRRTPVILGPFYYYPSGYSQAREGWDVNWNNAGLLAEAGVKVALASNDAAGPANLLLWAALAARHGLPPEDALKAVTTNPAEILGVANRVGSLRKGRDADLLVVSGDPLAATTRIEKVLINGRVVFEAESGADADDEK
ncbi:MAG: amidohydrolase family protein, partial [Armatimonadota bacterium]